MRGEVRALGVANQGAHVKPSIKGLADELTTGATAGAENHDGHVLLLSRLPRGHRERRGER